MELKWLEDFVTLANTASFSRSAEMRHVTQSAYSRRIKRLETWLGVTLVSRATIPAELTPEGRRFLPVAQDLIRSSYAIREALAPADAQTAGLLRIAALHTLSVTVLPEWIERIEGIHPGVRSILIPDRGGIEDNLDALVNDEADLFLTYSHPFVPLELNENSFDSILYGTEQIVPVVAARMRDPLWDKVDFGAPDPLSAAHEAGLALPYLDYGVDSFFGTALDRLFSMRNLRRRTVHLNSMCSGLRALALQGVGLCWLPEALIRDDLARGALRLASSAPDWTMRVDVRFYRHRGKAHPVLDAIWGRQTA
ncbi:LysR family transcriptional regulator [Paenirhodobacter enshiensis]|uniref:LysR family transcriptional regulator n=1 Tax=Paenirhodobacter enshiensis TaxID=1105367 RepID=UPI0035B42B0A